MCTHLRSQTKGKNIQVVGFADVLKDTCYALYAWAGMKRKEHYEQFPDERTTILATGETVRATWIAVGNHMRGYDQNCWVKAVLNMPNVDHLIIKDLRFPNEVHQVREHGGHCVKVMRPNVPEIDDDADIVLKSFEDWDDIVINDGTLQELNVKAKALCLKYFGV